MFKKLNLDRSIKSTCLATAVIACLLFSLAGPASAANPSWVYGASIPTYPDHLVSTDAEYPVEDIFGDGLTHDNAEDSLDVRSTYLAVQYDLLYLMSYVYATSNASSSTELYWFLDTDNNPATGGPADADSESPPITCEATDPDLNGYEMAIVNVSPGGGGYVFYKWEGGGWVEYPPDSSTVYKGGNIEDPMDSELHFAYQVIATLDELGLHIGDDVRVLTRTWKSSSAQGDLNGGVTSYIKIGDWAPYADAAYTIEQYYFPGATPVYLKGEGFNDGGSGTTYKVAYYNTLDGLEDTHVVTSEALTGIITDEVDSGGSDGVWHCVVLSNETSTIPPAYPPAIPYIAETYFVVDAYHPVAPTITSPLTGTVTNDATPTISGTGEASVIDRPIRIDIYVGATLAGQVNTDLSGNWSFTTSALPDGDYVFLARAFDGLYYSDSYSNAVNLTIDTTPPAVPTITSPVDGSYSNVSSPEVTGTTSPGATVTVYVDGSPVGTTTADGSGDWSLTLPEQTDGTHTIEADAADAVGNTSAKSSPVTVIIGAGTYPYITEVTFDGVTIIDNDFIASDAVLAAMITDEGEAGIDPASIVIIVDEGTGAENTISGLATYYNAVTNVLSYQFAGANVLTEGTHTIRIDAASYAGNKASDASPDRSVEYTVQVSLGEPYLDGPPRPYPNPFNPGDGPTKITYKLNRDTLVKLMIFNINANLVRSFTCPAGTEGGRAGYNEVEFDGYDFKGRLLASQALLVFIFNAEPSTPKLLGKTKAAIYNR